jgi:hypothetical protein
MKTKLMWKLHTPNLLNEISQNSGQFMYHRPLQLLGRLLAMVAERAIELNDPQLNELMCRLTLYEQSNPESSQYSKELMRQTEMEAREQYSKAGKDRGLTQGAPAV